MGWVYGRRSGHVTVSVTVGTPVASFPSPVTLPGHSHHCAVLRRWGWKPTTTTATYRPRTKTRRGGIKNNMKQSSEVKVNTMLGST